MGAPRHFNLFRDRKKGEVLRLKTQGNGADPGGFVGHSQDSGLENCEFAEEKSGAGEGNRTLVFLGKSEIIENGAKTRVLSATGYRRVTLNDNRPTRFFSATKEFHDCPSVVSRAINLMRAGSAQRRTGCLRAKTLAEP